MKHNPKDPEGPQFCAEEGWHVSLTGEHREKTITDRAIELLRERERKGIKTYGRPLLHDYKTLVEWLTDAAEERADDLQYLLAALESARELERERLGG